MTKASDNEFPHVTLTEVSAPSTPASGLGLLYEKSDGKAYFKNDGGTEYDLTSSGTGSDLVQVASGAGSIRLPGLAASGWIPPGSAGTLDDEFDTTDTSDPMTGWTTFQTPTAHDINSTALSCYYLKKTATAASTGHVGIYKSWSPSAGQFVTAGLLDCVQSMTNFQRGGGIFVGETNPVTGKTLNFWIVNNGHGPAISVTEYSAAGTFTATRATYGGGTADPEAREFWTPIAFRIRYNSSTSLDFDISRSGRLWTPVLRAYNPGFTIAQTGIVLDTQQGTYDGELLMDFFRSSW